MANLLHLTGQALRSSTGTPYTSAKAYFYETGTTTPKNTYSDAGLTSANTNPVTADGTTGIFPDIYLLAGRYKVVLQQSDGTSIDTWDPYDATQQIITATAAPSPAYPFMVYHNSTDGHRYRRNAANNAWIDEGLVDSLGNATTVTNQLAGTATAEFSTPDSVAALWQRGTDIASAATLSLPATGGGVFNVTGTTGVNGISSAAGGRKVLLRFAGALTLTHNGTSFILPGAASITTAAGDVFEFTNEAAQDATGSNWRCTNKELASGSPLNLTAFLGTQADAETATSTTKTLVIGNVQYHPGVAKARVMWDASSGTPTAAGTSYNISSLGDTGVGIVTVNFTTSFSSANYMPAGITQRNATNSDGVLSVTFGTAPTASALAVTTHTAGTGGDFSYSAVDVLGDQ